MISTAHRINYAKGFLTLGMLDEASAELEAIGEMDRLLPETLTVRFNFYTKKRLWENAAALGRIMTAIAPSDPAGWIGWAESLREMGEIAEAQTVLRTAEFTLSNCAMLHYHLASYAGLLGDAAEARRRFRKACILDATMKDKFWSEPALRLFWSESMR